jgi:CheY-like chemotaxis protein
MMSGAVRLLVVDDEPLYLEVLRLAVESQMHGSSVIGLDRPRRIEDEHVATATHAVVDLSFGELDFDGAEPALEPETGVDAIARLRHARPDLPVAVATRLDHELVREMAFAIRSWWPSIPFLHKRSEVIVDQVTRFVLGRSAVDNVDFVQLLSPVRQVDATMLIDVIGSLPRRHGARDVLVALSACPAEPSLDSIVSTVGLGHNTVKRLSNELRSTINNADLSVSRLASWSDLWRWSRARRAILESLPWPAGWGQRSPRGILGLGRD